MIYIIEGADMTGKTTLAKELQQRFNLGYEHIHTKHFDYYKDSILLRDNMVYDRHFISEMLYPRVFGREPKLNWGEFQVLMELIKENKEHVKLIILTADDVEFMQRLNERPNEPTEVISTLFEIDKEYKAIGTLFDVQVFNTVDLSTDQILEAIGV